MAFTFNHPASKTIQSNTFVEAQLWVTWCIVVHYVLSLVIYTPIIADCWEANNFIAVIKFMGRIGRTGRTGHFWVSFIFLLEIEPYP